MNIDLGNSSIVPDPRSELEEPTSTQGLYKQRIVWTKTTTTRIRHVNGRTVTTTDVVENGTSSDAVDKANGQQGPEDGDKKAGEPNCLEGEQTRGRTSSRGVGGVLGGIGRSLSRARSMSRSAKPKQERKHRDRKKEKKDKKPKEGEIYVRPDGKRVRRVEKSKGKYAKAAVNQRQEEPESTMGAATLATLSKEFSASTLSKDSCFVEGSDIHEIPTCSQLSNGTSTTTIQNINGRKVTTTVLVEDATPEEIEAARKWEEAEAKRKNEVQAPYKRTLLSKTRRTMSAQNINGGKRRAAVLLEDSTLEQIEAARQEEEAIPEKNVKLEPESTTSVSALTTPSKEFTASTLSKDLCCGEGSSTHKIPTRPQLLRGTSSNTTKNADDKKVNSAAPVGDATPGEMELASKKKEAEGETNGKPQAPYRQTLLDKAASAKSDQNINGRKGITTVLVEDATAEGSGALRKEEEAKGEKHGKWEPDLSTNASTLIALSKEFTVSTLSKGSCSAEGSDTRELPTRPQLSSGTSTTTIKNVNGRKVTTIVLVEDATPEEIEAAQKKEEAEAAKKGKPRAPCRRTLLTKRTSTTSVQNINGRKRTTTVLVEDATPEEIEAARKKEEAEAERHSKLQAPCRRTMLAKTTSTMSVENINGRKRTTTVLVEEATPEEIEMARKKQEAEAEKHSKLRAPCRRTLLAKATSTISVQSINGRKVTTTRVVEDATPEEMEMARKWDAAEAARSSLCKRSPPAKTTGTTNVRNVNGHKISMPRVSEDATPDEIEMTQKSQEASESISKEHCIKPSTHPLFLNKGQHRTSKFPVNQPRSRILC